jgi:uridylate kinase
MTEKSIYPRVLLKLSGETLNASGQKGVGFDKVAQVADDIKQVLSEVDVEMAILIGGGNIFRGRDVGDRKLKTPARVHYMGMLATMINGLALKTAFEELKLDARVMSSVRADEVAEPFLYEKAISHLASGLIVILAGGSGKPFFTTDTAAANHAATLNCNALLKGTNVDGAYDCDPKSNPHAKMYRTLTFEDAIVNNLTVMDRSAFDLCQRQNIPIVIFNNRNLHDNLRDILVGKEIGTLITDGS